MTETQFDFQSRPHSKDRTFTRTVKAPRDKVFEVFTKAEHLVHWWAPKPFTTHNCKLDLRPGGEWTYTFRSPDGQEHNAKHIYKEVDPPKKLVMEAGVPGPSGKLFFKIRQTITFEDKGMETALAFAVKVLEANPGSDPFLGGMEQGTNMTLDNLTEYLAGKK